MFFYFYFVFPNDNQQSMFNFSNIHFLRKKNYFEKGYKYGKLFDHLIQDWSCEIKILNPIDENLVDEVLRNEFSLIRSKLV